MICDRSKIMFKIFSDLTSYDNHLIIIVFNNMQLKIFICLKMFKKNSVNYLKDKSTNYNIFYHFFFICFNY